MKTLFSIATAVLALNTFGFAANPVVVNEVCPVCGKTAKLVYHTDKGSERIIFASGDCKSKYDKSPGKYQVKKKG